MGAGVGTTVSLAPSVWMGVGAGVLWATNDGALVGVVCAFMVVGYPRRNIKMIENK